MDTGRKYSDLYGIWNKVIIQATIKIVLKDFEVPIVWTSSQLILSSDQWRNAIWGEYLESDKPSGQWYPSIAVNSIDVMFYTKQLN